MNSLKRIIFFATIYLVSTNLCFSKINLKIVMKINNEIVTSYDIEQEKNYLLALNPNLEQIDEVQLIKIAKKSLTKEIVRKIEILKYKELKLENTQIESVLNNLMQNLNFTNKNEFENYLKEFDLSIKDLKKIEIENEWKNMIYVKYNDSVIIDKEKLIFKIDNLDNDFLIEYNLSEIFSIEKDTNYENKLTQIKKSIENNGFENTANLFSVSDSSKIGGKIVG